MILAMMTYTKCSYLYVLSNLDGYNRDLDVLQKAGLRLTAVNGTFSFPGELCYHVM